MTQKKNWANRLIHFMALGFSIFNTLSRVITLIEVETRQAKKNFGILIFLFLISSLLLSAIWFCLLTFLSFYFIYSLNWTWPPVLLIILLINIILLFIVYFRIKKITQYTFQKTRYIFKKNN